ncbi:MAG: sugar ABC transporter ATP-binding protein [Treponema sp.]|jgi:inositol transport system ATP-binding protein|nr:sugar ABC transporter ATP-binding protein [Treponema sp.]
MAELALELRNISKSFAGVKALDGVTFTARKGTVHSIVGENGAGKSTLMKILNGMYNADAGQIFIDGREVVVKSPRQAAELGIAMIFQELQFVARLRIEENLVLGNHPVSKKTGLVDWKRIHREAQEILDSEGIPHSPKTLMGDISLSDIQLIEIIKATRKNAHIIIMDEPTSSLTQFEIDRLFDKIRRLRGEGHTIIYISHKIDEIFALSDDVTTMRDGKIVRTGPIGEFTPDKIITMMVGRQIEDIYPRVRAVPGAVQFEVRRLSRGRAFRDIDLSVRRGELVGIAGLVGAGRSEIVRAIAGLDPFDGGEILIDGKPVKIDSVGQAIAHGIMLATEDRRRYGFIPIRSIKENITLASLKKFSLMGFIKKSEEKKQSRRYFDRLRIKAGSINTEVFTLSGGNQQKVVLAKWMLAGPKVFIMDEPTRGIDVGAKYEIYKIIQEMTETGISVIMISSELPELIGMCRHIYVVAEGRIAGELSEDEISETRIMALATGGR